MAQSNLTQIDTPLHDKGNLATIGRASAVAEVKHFRLSGFLAWITWLTVHLWYLIGFENRLLVLTRWAFSFVSHGRGARLITDPSQRSTTGAPVAFLPAAPRQQDAKGDEAALARKHKRVPSPAQPFPSLNTDEASGL